VTTAKLFRDGRSQAVRLPKEFWFDGGAVSIRREGESVVLTPVRKRRWPRGYWKSWGKATLDLEPIEPLS
jgi:antitoxin VapB